MVIYDYSADEDAELPDIAVNWTDADGDDDVTDDELAIHESDDENAEAQN